MSHFGANIKKIRKLKKLSQTAFADLFSITRAAVASYEEGRAEPKFDKALVIANYFSLSLDQLLGKELTVNELARFDIFRPEFGDANSVPHNLRLVRPNRSEICYVSANEADAYVQSFKKQEYLDSLPQVVLPIKVASSPRAFEHSGHEMQFENRGLSNGDLLIGQRADKKKLSDAHLGILYIVVTAEGIFTRRLAAIDKELEFHCDNGRYAPLLVAPNKVLELWELKGVFSTNLQHPSVLEARLSRLEGDN